MKQYFKLLVAATIALPNAVLAERCFGGRTNEYIAFDFADEQAGFCSLMCFTKEYWESGSGPETVQRFIFAADQSGVSIDRIREDFSHNFEYRKEMRFGSTIVHIYSCLQLSGETSCTNRTSELCASW